MKKSALEYWCFYQICFLRSFREKIFIFCHFNETFFLSLCFFENFPFSFCYSYCGTSNSGFLSGIFSAFVTLLLNNSRSFCSFYKKSILYYSFCKIVMYLTFFSEKFPDSPHLLIWLKNSIQEFPYFSVDFPLILLPATLPPVS